MKHLFVITALSITFSAATAAQAFRNAGSTGAQFLKIGVGARAMGMGGAYGSFDGDVAALAWNPAGIGTIQSPQLSVQYTNWIAEMTHNFIGLVVPITDQLNLGFHTVYLTTGKIEITTIDNPEGTGSSYDGVDIAVGLTMSARLTSQLTFASTVNYLQERISDATSDGLSLDAGMWYATGFRSLVLGFSLSNLGFDQKFSGRSLEVKYNPNNPGESLANAEIQTQEFSTPLLFRAAGSFDLFEMFNKPIEDNTLRVAVDFTQNSDTPERLAVGAEYLWQNFLSFRSGYLFGADELSWSAGAGARIGVSGVDLQFDYAVSALGRFGLGHRMGISISYR